MQLSQLDRVELKPVGKMCCNCAFCGKRFMVDDYYCLLADRIYKILVRYPPSCISCIYNTTCGMFSPKEEFAKMFEVEELEEFEMLKTFGKFSGIPDEVLKIRANWFLDQNDATDKQVDYVEYLVEANNRIPPLKIGGNINLVTVNQIHDKKILREWIGSQVESRIKANMI